MSNLAVNAAQGFLYPVGGVGSQSVYDYLVGKNQPKNKPITPNARFMAPNGDVQTPYRSFNRSSEEIPKYPHFQFMPSSNCLLTAWHAHNDKEPVEFETISLNNMSRENLAWLRADGEFNYLGINKSEKLLSLVYRSSDWRIDVRRSNNFQLREVIHHNSPISGAFFHNEVLFSLSNQLIISYPEDRLRNIVLSSNKKILGWAQHPTEPYLVIIKPENYRIINMDTLEMVKNAEWDKEIKWFNILQNYSLHGLNLHSNNSIAVFSKDGNHLFLGGYGKIAMLNWHDMLRPRCLQPEAEKIIDICSNKSVCCERKRTNNYIVDIEPINRDRILCVTADGRLTLINTRTDEKHLLLNSGNGVRINSLQLCANNKRLAMLGYYYGIDNYGNCKIESTLLIWKLSRLLSKAACA